MRHAQARQHRRLLNQLAFDPAQLLTLPCDVAGAGGVPRDRRRYGKSKCRVLPKAPTA
jgi:hypothetical protein